AVDGFFNPAGISSGEIRRASNPSGRSSVKSVVSLAAPATRGISPITGRIIEESFIVRVLCKGRLGAAEKKLRADVVVGGSLKRYIYICLYCRLGASTACLKLHMDTYC